MVTWPALRSSKVNTGLREPEVVLLIATGHLETFGVGGQISVYCHSGVRKRELIRVSTLCRKFRPRLSILRLLKRRICMSASCT
jgi:hypothetical protein